MKSSCSRRTTSSNGGFSIVILVFKGLNGKLWPTPSIPCIRFKLPFEGRIFPFKHMWLVCIVLWMLEDSLTSTTLRFEARECLQPGETCDNLLLFTRQGWTSKRLMQAAQADQSRDRKWLFWGKSFVSRNFRGESLKTIKIYFLKNLLELVWTFAW